MKNNTKILLVEDVSTDAELAQREIKKSLFCEFLCVDTREDFLNALSSFNPDLIVSDYRMPSFDGLTALKLATQHVPETPVIILTSAINEDTAVECMKAGAKDYVIKEHIKRLGQAILHALEEKEIAAQRRKAEEEKKMLESLLMQAQKLESIGRLAGGVAHDFNNMLSIIIGFTQLIKSQLPQDNSIMHPLLEIEKAALRSSDITRKLLAFSRNQITSPKIVNINELIRTMKESVLQLIGEDIEITFTLADDLWNIKFDPTQFEQIIMNLVVNARDAMPEGGQIIIKTENAVPDDPFFKNHPKGAPGHYIKLTVEDKGSGMDEETMTHIFEPFFTTKEIGIGTGLGLATVYGIIRQNEGFVFVDSEIGEGTTFHIYIPGNVIDQDVENKGMTEQIQHGNGTILLVEDEEMLKKMITDILTRIGYQVIPASGSIEAITICKEKNISIDLLLTDVVMPGINGYELKEKIEEMIPNIKTLFMSGYAPDLIAKRGMHIEKIDIIQKPFDIRDLAKKVHDVIAR